MNKLLSAAVGLALSATAFSASAQKAYTEGVAIYDAKVNGQSIEAKVFFKGDSSATARQQGPASIKVIQFKDEAITVLVDVPVANMKKAAVGTPGEVEEMMSQMPSFTFKPGTETKVINGFKCTKVIATDAKANKSYDVWVTKDITAPSSAYGVVYAKAGGFPVEFTLNQMGMTVTNTLKSISGDKVPAGTFSIPAGYDKMTLTDLKALGGGR
ncbi:DUF4412 domain-containing protein [Mucilaginibacter aquatilis]|uniref:DUF4412 domain-containing protein n=1 Tax=Mucilaginibacter aquatilis TaxID=1517760 RepID=A0A6I4I3Q3_9SPHI|nr:DUF4412 domain-containing protein [Mucilaginibacter aquatilis]MVN89671.1 DUF4412 domain-containing protein [Mucilaginibacter aquatilis]